VTFGQVAFSSTEHNVNGRLDINYSGTNALRVRTDEATGTRRQLIQFFLGQTTASGGIDALNGAAPQFYTSSDERLKEGIVDVPPGALARLNQVRLRDYWLTGQTDIPKHRGVIAQEIQQVYPEHVSEDEGGYLNVSMGWEWELIQAVQEITARLEALENV
jgi:hypothetical protein